MRTVPALIHAHCTSLEKKHATRPHTRKIAFYFKPYLYRLYLHIGFMRDDAGVEVLEILPGTQPRGGTERVPPSQFHCSIVFFFYFFFVSILNPQPLLARYCPLQHECCPQIPQPLLARCHPLQHAGCTGTTALFYQV